MLTTEHLGDLKNSKEKSHMFQHLGECHPELLNTLNSNMDVTQVFTFTVLKKDLTSLNRQITEAVNIVRAGGSALNKKEEYNRSSIPTNTVSQPQPTRHEPVPSETDQAEMTSNLGPQKQKRPKTRSQAAKARQEHHQPSKPNTTNTPTAPTKTRKSTNERQCSR